MKSTYYAVIATLLLIGAFIAIHVYQNNNRAQPYVPQVQTIAGDNAYVIEDTEEMYIVKLSDGVVCIFEYNSPDVVYNKTDILQSQLTEVDKKLLENGIVVYNQQELTMLIEDFDS